ncbi:MAG: RnfABCDGE type electron transport complex subunit G [Lachnospiraceae bacterium]|nr:RnfABCDGE type electron transport complex subunit G [Lachnospiraceae bacterium]
MKNNIGAVVILTVITLVSGILLGFVYELTKEPIAFQEDLAKQEAYKIVFPDAVIFEEAADSEDSAVQAEADKAFADAGLTQESVEEVMGAYDSDKNLLGYVLSVKTMEGYGGEIDISMGVRNDGTLNGIEILSIGETAGLGMKADTPEFKDQFKDKAVSQFSYTKSGASQEYEIDALSGATITTNAMVNAVNAGLIYFDKFLKTEGGGN